MKLNVHVLGQHVGVLEQVGDFKSVVAYLPDLAPESLVSLTMPVRTESYLWDDELHPIFRMNLPEGYVLQVLQEEFGPIVGASPIALLSVIGPNMVGRMQVTLPGATLDEPAKPIEVSELLKEVNSEEAFSRLVREPAKSGVSGVLLKFLDTEAQHQQQEGFGPHKKAILFIHQHIIMPFEELGTALHVSGRCTSRPRLRLVNLMPHSDGLPAVMNGIFLKFEREFPGAMPVQEIAIQLGADEGELFALLGVEEARSCPPFSTSTRLPGTIGKQAVECTIRKSRRRNQFGYRRDELLGQKVTNIIPEGFAERLIADGTRSAEDALAQQIGTGIELTGRRKDKKSFLSRSC
jgi:HipA-like protein